MFFNVAIIKFLISFITFVIIALFRVCKINLEGKLISDNV